MFTAILAIAAVAIIAATADNASRASDINIRRSRELLGR